MLLYPRFHETERCYMWPVIMLLLMIPSPHAQESQRSEDAIQAPERSAEYRVGAGDQLSLSVFGLRELDQTMRVSNSGKIHVSHVGTISVANMTMAQVEDEIARRLREQQLLKEPWVRIGVTEYRSQPVFVVGEVATPGQYMMTGEMRLLDVITKAGGFTAEIGADAYVFRRRDFSSPMTAFRIPEATDEQAKNRPEPPTGASIVGSEQTTENPPAAERIRISIRDLRQGNRPELNIRLRGGDVIQVSRRKLERIFIVGEVLAPGAYGLPVYYDHITAGRALAYAGGPQRTAKTGKGFIMRKDLNGGYQAVPFDFVAVTKGQQPDIPIRPDDIIFVPRSVGKKVAWSMFDYLPELIHQFLIF